MAVTALAIAAIASLIGSDAAGGARIADERTHGVRAAAAVHYLRSRHVPKTACVEVHGPPDFAAVSDEVKRLVEESYPQHEGCGTAQAALVWVGFPTWSGDTAYVEVGELAVTTAGRPTYAVRKRWFGGWKVRLRASAE
jgi:hypothetical protein